MEWNDRKKRNRNNNYKRKKRPIKGSANVNNSVEAMYHMNTLNKNKKKKSTFVERKTGTIHKKGVNIVGILIGLVLVAVVAFAGIYASHIFFEEEVIEGIDLGEPTLPQVAFMEEGYEVNTLLAYTVEMDILTMRDTICPLTPQGYLNLVLKPYENKIMEVAYQVYSIDGSQLLKEESITEWEDDELKLNLSNVIPDTDESLLKLSLTLEDGSVLYYYTRLITYGSSNLSSNLDFVQSFHEATFTAESDEGGSSFDIATYLTSTTETGDGSLQYVTESSSQSDVMWGTLNPEIIGEVSWSITECSSLYVSVLLEYQVEAVHAETGGTETYDVDEFYRVGYSSTTSSVQLKQFARTVNQVLDVNQITISQDGIDLGIVAEEPSYKVNTEETAFAFVYERALYLYNGVANELIPIFTLESESETDSRTKNEEYDISILSVDENGSVAFVVYGYMNRGVDEGEVGTGIYYYDATTNTMVEKAFVASSKSFAVGQEELSQGMYYSSTQNIIYVMAQNAFYEVNLTADTQSKLADSMSDDAFVITEDGKWIAYLTTESGDGEQCFVLELETGDVFEVATTNGDQITLLGFMDHDLIYGVYNASDTAQDEVESEITPMYKIEICNEEGIVQKTYEHENQYIREISIQDNMITMNLVEMEAEEYVYVGQDVITNNATEVEESIAFVSYTTDQKQVQKRLTFSLNIASGIDVAEAEIVVPKMVVSEDAIQISYTSEESGEMYYAYAYGALQVQSSTASEAIQYASQNTGAVVNENQAYVWRSGSRDLTYTVSNDSDLSSRVSGGESAIEIVVESANGNVVFYTGCTTEQMCYIINQGQVIAAKLEDESWILLIGYTGDTMYYLNVNGVKQSIDMDSLDETVIELVGDGRF